MNDAEMIKELWVTKSIAILAADRANPDVGWGMSITDSMDIAKEEIRQEAARWNSMAAIALEFPPDLEKIVVAKIKNLTNN